MSSASPSTFNEVATKTPPLDHVTEMLCEALELPKGTLTGNETLTDIKGWDSLAVLNFMAQVDKSMGITLSSDKILVCQTVRDLAMLLK
jgi:acyl carrier protein